MSALHTLQTELQDAIHSEPPSRLRNRLAAWSVLLLKCQDGTARTPDAHVAAAAPDLLEAAKLLQAALSEYRLLDVRKRFSLSLAHAAAGAAIAKAEGR